MTGLGVGLGLNALLTMGLWGDSITVGAGTASGDTTKNTGYRYPLWNALQGVGINAAFVGNASNGHDSDVQQIHHDGVIGDTISMISTRVQATFGIRCPEVALLYAGTNNVQLSQSASSIATELDALILLMWQLGQRPGYNKTKLIEVAQIGDLQFNDSITTAYNALIPDICATHRANGRNVHEVDMFTALGPNPGPNWNPSSTPHPSETGYNLMPAVWMGAAGSGLLRDYTRQ